MNLHLKITLLKGSILKLLSFLLISDLGAFELYLLENNSESYLRPAPVRLFLFDGENNQLRPIAKIPSSTGTFGRVDVSSRVSRGYFFSTSADHQGLDYIQLNGDFASESFQFWLSATPFGKVFQISSFGNTIAMVTESGVYTHDLYPSNLLYHLYWDKYDFKKIFSQYIPFPISDLSNSLEINHLGIWFLEPGSNRLFHYSRRGGEKVYALPGLETVSTFTVINHNPADGFHLVYGNDNGCYVRNFSGAINKKIINSPCSDLVAGPPHLAVLHRSNGNTDSEQRISIVNFDHPNFPFKSFKIPSESIQFSQISLKKGNVFNNPWFPNLSEHEFYDLNERYSATLGLEYVHSLSVDSAHNFETYQWFKDNIPISEKKKTEPVLSFKLSEVSEDDSGNYWLILESEYQRVTTSSFLLNVVGLELNIHSVEVSGDSESIIVQYTTPSIEEEITVQQSFDLIDWGSIYQIIPERIGLNQIKIDIPSSIKQGFFRISPVNH